MKGSREGSELTEGFIKKVLKLQKGFLNRFMELLESFYIDS